MTQTNIRPMTLDDVDAVARVVHAADDDAERRAGREPEEYSEEHLARFRTGMQRFVERDPGGAWVATDGDTVVGMAEAVRRDTFWGLSMLFVDPRRQGQGLGRRLLDAALTYAEGADVRMIMTSLDPRALRRYSGAGLRLHPTVEATGTVDAGTVPADLPGRRGGVDDLDLVADVDKGLRGSRAEDVEFALRTGARIEVVDDGPDRAFALHRNNRLALLGGTDEATASLALWRFLASTAEAGEKAQVWCMTARQDWAVRVALAARLTVVPAGPLFLDGLEHPPGPWLPSGWYF